MERVKKFALGGATILASMDDQTELMTSLPKRSRFFVIVLLCFCFVCFIFLYTSSEKPTIRAIDKLKEAWHLGEYGHRGGINEDERYQSPPNITSARNSTYRFDGSGGMLIAKGSTLRLVIEARDLAGKRTTKGGDMWYATLNSLRPKASTAGKVVDNGDGTYDVTFYAGWEGVARIDVILVHPKEACSFVEQEVWPTEERAVWIGTFQEKDHPKPRTHTETCVLRRSNADWADKCEYWYPKEVGYTTLICGKPADRDIWACDDLYALKSLTARVLIAVTELIEGREYLFSRENVMQMVENGPKHVLIQDTDNYQPVVLPPCRSGAPSSHEEGQGYWLKDEWHSLHCQNSQWGNNASNSQDATRCLRGKEVYFLGDTTARQWFEAFQESIGYKFFLRNDDAHYRFSRHYPPFNISVLYQAQPLLTTSANVPFDEVQFEVDVLDGLVDPRCNYVLLLSPWSHTNWDRASFLERLGLVKDAVVRLKRRCPEARVVVSGPHPISHGTWESPIYADNVLLRSIRDSMVETFRGTGSSFLDVWDMSLAYPSPNKLNMPAEVIQQGVYRFLSYVC